MSYFDTNPKKLKDELLNLIHIREMALPDFQRDFVWQPRQTKALLISLAQSFPAGSLLRMVSNNLAFAPRAFASAPGLDGHMPMYLVLDGQQRLTSLYQALYGTGEHLYYVCLGRLAAGGDLEDVIFYERRDVGEKRYGTLKQQAASLVLPLQVIFGGQGFYSWLDDVAEIIEKDPALQGQFDRKALREAYQAHIEKIVTYEFPVVTLPADTSLEAVCTIFETLNSTGVRLSVFDLLGARYFARGKNLRQLWLEALEATKHLQAFEIDPYYVLQVISARCKNSINRSDVLRLDASAVVEAWRDAVWGMDQALDFLVTECGVLSAGWLSYNTILVPLAYAFMVNRGLRGAAVGAFREKVRCWYWCSVFGQTYESNPTSQTMVDINQLAEWFAGGPAPEAVADFRFDRASLFTTTMRQRAVYRGIMCLMLRRPPRDFHSATKLTAGLIEEQRVDDHHVFPKGYLAPLGIPEREIDSILNKALIDRQTNQSIGSRAPSVYLQEIEKRLGAHELDQVLISHCLPVGPRSSLRRDDFEAFRQERADAFCQLINEMTARPPA